MTLEKIKLLVFCIDELYSAANKIKEELKVEVNIEMKVDLGKEDPEMRFPLKISI